MTGAWTAWEAERVHPVTDDVTAAERYRRFAVLEAAGSSPQYERLALAVAADETVLAMLGTLDRVQQQPNLLFGALRLHGVDTEDENAALAWVRDHEEDVLAVLRTRRTQTNEAARCAVLLPFLAQAAGDGPVALVELGASAGLCLLYDRYRYEYRTPAGVVTVDPAGAAVTLACDVRGVVELPDDVPEIRWRAGVDLHPVDATDPDEAAWLQALVWPEHTDRAQRLAIALAAASSDPPRVVTADFVSGLRNLLERTPSGTTVVVTHSAALAYAPLAVREEVLAMCGDAGAVRIGMEGREVLPDLRGLPPQDVVRGSMVASVDDAAVALAHPHGRWVQAL